jgi:anti-sigma factor RsiW
MIGEHVGKLLSGYIDGELTQQQRQRVEVHCSDCAECERELEALASLRREIGVSELSQFGEDTWRETMADTTTKAARGIGWLLLIGGAMAAAGVAVFAFLGISVHLRLATEIDRAQD